MSEIFDNIATVLKANRIGYDIDAMTNTLVAVYTTSINHIHVMCDYAIVDNQDGTVTVNRTVTTIDTDHGYNPMVKSGRSDRTIEIEKAINDGKYDLIPSIIKNDVSNVADLVNDDDFDYDLIDD